MIPYVYQPLVAPFADSPLQLASVPRALHAEQSTAEDLKSMLHSYTGGDLSLLMDMDPSYCMADPMEGTHRGGMLRPSMHPIKPQPAAMPCCTPQHPKTPPQPIMGHR